MIIKNYVKTINALYDSVLNLSIEYVKQYNLYCVRIAYGAGRGDVAFVRVATGNYIINKLQQIDVNRKHWSTTDLLLWTMINNINWM